MGRRLSVARRTGLEEKILYYGPADKARETKELVKELFERKIIDLCPVEPCGKKEGENYSYEIKVCAENENRFSILGNKEMRISPNSSDYQIKYLNRPLGRENIRIDFVDLLSGRIAFSYKDHSIMIFRDYVYD